MQHYAAFHLGLHCLQNTRLGVKSGLHCFKSIRLGVKSGLLTVCKSTRLGAKLGLLCSQKYSFRG